MSASVDQLFITKWEKEVSHEFQREESLVRSSVKNYHGVGEDFSFPRMRSATVQRDKARHADLVPVDLNEDRRSATIHTIHSSTIIDNLDLVRTNVDVRGATTYALVAAVNRDIDAIIIEEFGNSTNSETALPTANTLNSNGYAKMSEVLSLNDVPYEDRFAIISPPAMTDTLADTTLVSSDYVRNQGIEKGRITGVFGFDIVQHTGLANGAAGSTERRCYFGHKRAAGLAVVKELTMTVKEVPMKDGWVATAKAAVGSKIIEEEGLQYCDVTN